MEFLLDPNPTDAQAPGAPPGELIKDATVESFTADVIEKSVEVPVIVDFWAPWCGPCKQLGPTLEKLVRQAGGLVRLVKVNIDENQALATQMRIQSIPAVFAFQGGRPVDGFIGAQPESQIKSFVDRLLGGAKPPLEQALDAARQTLEAGDHPAATALYSEILNHEPGHASATAGLLRCLVASGDLDGARHFADAFTAALRADTEIAAALSALELAEAGEASTGSTAEFQRRVEADANDHAARFDLAMALYGDADDEAAIETLLELLRRDRAWNDEAARKQLIKIFDSLGATHPHTLAGRKGLSSILFS
ncbi:MAG: thioredoxin [Rhodospirillales bacterium]|jgi:putative thioredoxin|nr:thioredoxin [Rhodospirillales bacterium]